ncbi:protoporphyrinogen oxidase [Neorhodopirellula lusitana]|uniref:Coproporphyrinogen III oxidase n=1 Tax=Neorhodopirellula lusitana TaxID=445327 RepID=A0ABY1PU55_9BACT|nr:protoporphyrinogen oxidase [Neorhodopirellula lusitana]SMP46268.1 protoporphyrinogen oxidase [Neorhodopirellula lusitana]
MNPIKIAIVGGGLSGLAVGCHLRLLGAANSSPTPQVSLFEASDRIGGVIHTETIDTDAGTFTVDHGADMFTTNPSPAIDLCRQLDAVDGLLRPKPEGRGAMIARGNGLIRIPEGFVLMRATKMGSMVTTPLLSIGGKLRLLRERFVRPRDASVTDESVGSFVRRRLGAECLDHIVAPLVAGIYTADVDRLSMAATMKPIWDMESTDGSLAKATMRRVRSGQDSTEQGSSGARYEQFRAFPGGMIELIHTIRDGLGNERIHTDCPVESLQRTDDGRFRLSCSDQVFDRVVLATPARISTRLLDSLKASTHEQSQVSAIDTAVTGLGSISYASTAIVVMAVPRDRIKRLPKTFGFVVPPIENRAVLAGSFASEKFAGRSPDDHVIVRAFVGGVLQPGILKLNDDQIVQRVAGELGELIGLDTSEDLESFAAFTKVVRWNNAMPQYEVGHLDKVAEIESAMKQIPGVWLQTNAIGGVGIAPVIGAAKRTAQAILSTIPSV